MNVQYCLSQLHMHVSDIEGFDSFVRSTDLKLQLRHALGGSSVLERVCLKAFKTKVIIV